MMNKGIVNQKGNSMNKKYEYEKMINNYGNDWAYGYIYDYNVKNK